MMLTQAMTQAMTQCFSEAEPGRKVDDTVDETGSTTLVDAGEHDASYDTMVFRG